jgi:ribosomal protein S6
MFVMDNRQANRDWEGSLEKLKSMLSKHGAEILRCEKWGERKLAYEMSGRRRGTYVLLYFNATGQAVNQAYRECELSDLMLRALILKIDKMPPEEAMRSPEESAAAARSRPAPEPAAPAAAPAPPAAPAAPPATAAKE